MADQPDRGDGEQTTFARILAPFIETFGMSRAAATAAVVVIVAVVAAAVFYFIHSAPPKTLTITSGPPGSSLMVFAEKYSQTLSNNGVKLKILPSQGSLENLERLEKHGFHVDVGFIQSGLTNVIIDGVTNTPATSKLVSLGSISYQPLLIFYRGNEIKLLSELKGQRLAVGPSGSGTRTLAKTLLEMNGVGETNATFLDLDSTNAAAGLTNGAVDAAFLMGDSASPQMMRQLLLTPGLHIFNFAQAEGYTRRIPYLNRLEMPMGSIDFGQNIPREDLHLIGPTVELLARPNIHPALVDLLLEAAQDAHGSASLMRRRNEFPAAWEHDFPISDEATRFYKSGKSFLYRKLPFWLASLVNRILLAFIPMVVILIPALRAIPAMFKWRMRMLMYRRYLALLNIERELAALSPDEKRDKITARLDSIEGTLDKMKVPVSSADQFYNLRGHIALVRTRLLENHQTSDSQGN